MGNLKKLLSNKNVVTLLGAILIVVVLYLFYRWRVNAATQPVSIPFALHSIEPLSQITVEDVASVEIPQSSLQGNVISNVGDVYNKYSTYFIPAGSFFYASTKDSRGGNIANKEDLPATYLDDLEEGQIAFNYAVNTKTTFGNSFFPGKYFDIYLKLDEANDSNNFKFGRFITNLKIMAVRDGSGRDVFASTEEIRTPAQIIFAVDDEMNAYLRAAEKLNNVTIILVPTAADRKAESKNEEVPAPKIVNPAIQDYLDKYSHNIVSDETLVPTNNETNN